METTRFRNLSARHRALIALAVLLDGREAPNYLENDAEMGAALKRAASDLADEQVELRLPYLGTVLRKALQEIS